MREFVGERRVRLGDVTAAGRLRLDALARYLQDVAYDDTLDGGAPGRWVLRRMELRITSLPRFHDEVRLVTGCTGVGSRWAQRRTVVTGERADVEALAVWVNLDERGRPSALDPSFASIWGDPPQVSARLTLAGPEPDAPARVWPLRATDADVLGHVNNAIALAALEDELGAPGVLEHARVEVEYRDALDVSDPVQLVTAGDDPVDQRLWIVVDERPRVSIRVRINPHGRVTPQ